MMEKLCLTFGFVNTHLFTNANRNFFFFYQRNYELIVVHICNIKWLSLNAYYIPYIVFGFDAKITNIIYILIFVTATQLATICITPYLISLTKESRLWSRPGNTQWSLNSYCCYKEKYGDGTVITWGLAILTRVMTKQT